MRTRICLYLLLLVPLAVYWQSVFHEFGMPTDYASLRVAKDDPGQLVRVAAAQGRPLSGAMQETSFTVNSQVEGLSWLRVSTVLLLTLLGIVMWRQLCQSDWHEVSAAVVALGLVLLPGAQVLAHWAACWPHALTLLLALAGFSAIETEIERGGMKRLVALAGGCMIYTAAALVYQANVLFALTIVVAVLLERNNREPLSDFWWLTFHLVALAAGLVLARLVVRMLFASGVTQPELIVDHGDTVLGLLRYPLPNALALFVVNDDGNRGALLYWGAIIAVVTVLVLAYRKLAAGDEPLRRRRAWYAFGILLVVWLGTGLFAADSTSAYRTNFALAGIVLVLLVQAVKILLPFPRLRPWHAAIPAAVMVGVAYWAHFSSFNLLAEPQAREWQVVRGEVVRGNFDRKLRVHLVLPDAGQHAAERSYGDEFGFVASRSPELARELFAAAVRSRFQDGLPRGAGYTVTTGEVEPPTGSYDLLLDLRRAGVTP